MDTPDQQKPDLNRYVEVLRNKDEYPEGDAWISITDAARVTRTSEAMARRWVTSGRLAVRKEPVGLIPRTRLVRLSDVAAIRPIIDPTAAITNEVAKLDLASIPRQQLQIMEEHERLSREAATLEQSIVEIRDRLNRQDQLSSALEQQLTSLDETHSRTLQALKIALAEMGAELVADLEQTRKALTNTTEQHAAKLHRKIEDEERERQQDIQALTIRIQTQDEKVEEISTGLENEQRQRQQEREEITKRVDNLDKEKTALLKLHLDGIKEVRQEILTEAQALEKRQEAARETLSQELNRAIEQQTRQFTMQLEALERDQARDVATLTTRFETLTSRLEQTNATISSNQQRALTQENRLDALQYELEQEREARRVLIQQLQQAGRQNKTKGRRSETAE